MSGYLLYDTTKHPTSDRVNGVTQDSASPLGAHQGTLRTLNLALVARAVFARPGELARADVAAATGLTRSTVSRLVDELVRGGVLAEDVPAQRDGPGRPSVPLRPAAATFVALGLEANVEHLAAYVIDLSGAVLAHRLIRTRLAGSDPAKVLAELARLGRETMADVPGALLGVRAALPGIVEQRAGHLLRAPNLGWREVDVRSALAALAPEGTVVGVANEADCAALSIAHDRPGLLDAGLDSFMYVSGNVGIGSATVVAGRRLTGNHGWAGELGHVCVDPDGPTCGCGARGCLEAIAGRSSLLRQSGRHRWDDLLADAADPDLALARVLEQAGRALGIALSTALNLLDVSEVVLGGHLATLAPALLPSARTEMDTRVLSAPFAPVRVTTRTTPEASGALGAAYVEVLDLIDDPAAVLGQRP